MALVCVSTSSTSAAGKSAKGVCRCRRCSSPMPKTATHSLKAAVAAVTRGARQQPALFEPAEQLVEAAGDGAQPLMFAAQQLRRVVRPRRGEELALHAVIDKVSE